LIFKKIVKTVTWVALEFTHLRVDLTNRHKAGHTYEQFLKLQTKFTHKFDFISHLK